MKTTALDRSAHPSTIINEDVSIPLPSPSILAGKGCTNRRKNHFSWQSLCFFMIICFLRIANHNNIREKEENHFPPSNLFFTNVTIDRESSNLRLTGRIASTRPPVSCVSRFRDLYEFLLWLLIELVTSRYVGLLFVSD